jgi:hypothetical protein
MLAFKILSNSFLDHINPYRKDEVFKRLFSMSHVFDSIVSIVIANMNRSDIFREFLIKDDG